MAVKCYRCGIDCPWGGPCLRCQQLDDMAKIQRETLEAQRAANRLQSQQLDELRERTRAAERAGKDAEWEREQEDLRRWRRETLGPSQGTRRHRMSPSEELRASKIVSQIAAGAKREKSVTVASVLSGIGFLAVIGSPVVGMAFGMYADSIERGFVVCGMCACGGIFLTSIFS